MSMIPTREACGRALERLGQIREDIVVLEADISKSTKTCYFAEKYPKRFFNVGVAEQNLLGVAAGLSTTGYVPFVSTYAVFASMRGCEQIRTSLCYPGLNVKIAASHGGLTPGQDGVTHQGTEDMGIMRTIPNMTVVMPADAVATEKLVFKAAEYSGPVYIRLTRDAVPCIYGQDEEFHIGKAKILQEGKDVTIIAIGDMLSKALMAAEELGGEGIEAEIIDMHTLKPLDEETVDLSLRKTRAVVTVEDHNIINGLGSAISEYTGEHLCIPVKRVGLADVFGESGPYEELLIKYHMAVPDIKNAVHSVLSRKS